MVAGSEHGQNIHSRFLCQCKPLKIFLADKTKLKYAFMLTLLIHASLLQEDYHADSLLAYNL